MRPTKATAEVKAIVLARGSQLMDLRGVGPVVATRVLPDVCEVTRFADRNRFASWTGTAPLDGSSGEQNRHRLSRAGNRRMNHRDLDTRVGSVDVAVPKLREGCIFPDWLLQRRRRAVAALTTVVATCYLLGVSTRRMDKLVQLNGLIELHRRVARGFRNCENYRLRMLLIGGGLSHPNLT